MHGSGGGAKRPDAAPSQRPRAAAGEADLGDVARFDPGPIDPADAARADRERRHVRTASGLVSTPSTPPATPASTPSAPPGSGPRAAESAWLDLPGVLHEVSNDLTVVLGWLDRARDSASDPALVERALAIARSRAQEARAIVRRAIGAHVSPEPARTLHAVVADAVEGLDPELRKAGLTARMDIVADARGALLPDASHVVHVLTNLLLNAVAASPRGGIVHVDARLETPDRAVVAVLDDGPGIEPARRATLLEAGVSTRAGGAGIGLRHAAAVAREAGGSLSLAASERGARFELRWPVEAQRAVAPAAHATIAPRRGPGTLASPARPLEGLRLLVIEDDDAVIDLLEAVLGARGASLVSVRHRAAFDDAIARGSFDAALVDLSPLEGDVMGALSALVRTSPGVRLVVTSGNAGPPALPESWAATWVRKPFDTAEIVGALAS